MLFFIQLILNVAVLYSYDATHPYDGQSFSWDESKPATAVMSATFYEEVESFDVSKVHISPENWYSLPVCWYRKVSIVCRLPERRKVSILCDVAIM